PATPKPPANPFSKLISVATNKTGDFSPTLAFFDNAHWGAEDFSVPPADKISGIANTRRERTEGS
ncbi:MAG: hypothetical protein LUF28_01355, partial [Clostridiales bacterium]|nr:hypothetical protein [Clostridiales bacterium]